MGGKCRMKEVSTIAAFRFISLLVETLNLQGCIWRMQQSQQRSLLYLQLPEEAARKALNKELKETQ